ncbi:glycoprotein 3-alpha-L-fucosyltransferase [Schistosoma bovis]|uniref:Fucosyltransferase n=1 Tax=Schistosoma bovis TaxID=6184 RepID=A0A430QPZ8_SCHBO|nr:glycoprotein 3-alpha-L-fucosyltransferase [Schistosoma bovis]
MLDVDRMGIEAVIKEALQAVNPRLEKAIHLSFDIDALDPLVAPSTGTAVPGGLTLREGLRICEEVSATGKLSIVELAEINPLLGSKEDVVKTQSSAVQILRACLGHCRSGHLPFNVRNLTDQEKTFLSVKLIGINTHNVYKKYERSFSGYENLIFNIDYANFSIEKQKHVNVNSKRHLGSIDTKLFDIQGFILKKKFNMNNLILFPFETDNPYEDDRILAQMSYVPVQVLEARKNGRILMKRIYYASKSSNSFPDLSHCPVYECSVSHTIKQADLVVFENDAELSRLKKQKNQSWLIYHLESPRHFPFPMFKNLINFTATYTVDSTIVTPYYKYVPFSDMVPKDLNHSIEFDKDFSNGKTKMIAWFVDIYGACGDLICDKYNSTCFESLKNDYKFYLSFENSICQDYITEKNTVVPIVMGASKSEYVRSAPSNSFIHVDDFNSVKQLADYLYYLDNNKTAYNEYFKWHNHGTVDFNTFTDCRLCMLAHEIDNLERPYWYEDVNQWRENSCENRKFPII